MIHLDTSFLVDLLREARARETGHATALLNELADEELAISTHVACELYAGVELSSNPRKERQRVRALCESLHVTAPDEGFAEAYGRHLATLHRAGEPISTMDLLIAVSALQDDAPLITRNARHFARVHGLELIDY